MSCFARTNSVVSGRAAYGSGILHGVHMWLSLLEEMAGEPVQEGSVLIQQTAAHSKLALRNKPAHNHTTSQQLA